MIRVSNLRKEQLPQTQECRIVCDIECPFSAAKQLWFSVPEQFGDWLTDDVYDALMVAMLFPAMYYNQDLSIEGCVSEKLYDNITHYVQPCELAYLDYLYEIRVDVSGFSNTKKANHLVGTGFSGGVDAFSTLYDRFELEERLNYKLSSLFFYNVGSHGGGTEKARKKFYARYQYLNPLALELSLPLVPMDSNLFDFYRIEWEFDAGVFCRSTAILVFERVLDKYYTAYDYSYWEITHLTKLDYGAVTDMCIEMMLSTETLEVITDGTQYSRSDKIQRLFQYPLFLKYLNVCVSPNESVLNCSECLKCKRTLLTFDILNHLEDCSRIFDINKYKRCRFTYKCYTVSHRMYDIYAHDNYQLAKRMNYSLPPYVFAWLYMSPKILRRAIRKFGKRLLKRGKGFK